MEHQDQMSLSRILDINVGATLVVALNTRVGINPTPTNKYEHK